MRFDPDKLVTKVCIDPTCEAVAHNCRKGEIDCRDCGTRMVEINDETFRKKFAQSFFQYDYITGEYFRPASLVNATEIQETKSAALQTSQLSFSW